MDKALSMVVQGVLSRETNRFLDEVEKLSGAIGNRIVANNGRKESIGRSQFQMIMEGAAKASSVEEILLFINYQGSKNNSGWNVNCDNGKSIASNVIESLKSILEEVGNVIQTELTEAHPDQLEEYCKEVGTIKLKITEKFLGYLYWKATIMGKDGA